MTVECTPQGICSWNFNLSIHDTAITTSIHTFSESGYIQIGTVRYDIKKQSPIAGKWQMLQEHHIVYRATKNNPLTRNFKIQGTSASYSLEAEYVMRRIMKLQGDKVRLRIAPKHALTRRAEISGEWTDPVVVSFAFWLTTLTWRRAAAAAGAS